MWVRDCLVEGMADAKSLRWKHAQWVPGMGVAGMAGYGWVSRGHLETEEGRETTRGLRDQVREWAIEQWGAMEGV